MIINNKYILASSSKSRCQILKNIGFNFKQVKPLCDEEIIKKKLKNKFGRPRDVAKKLSYEKARSISIINKYSSLEVIGCDTIIFLNGTIYDKAKTLKQARNKIKRRLKSIIMFLVKNKKKYFENGHNYVLISKPKIITKGVTQKV